MRWHTEELPIGIRVLARIKNDPNSMFYMVVRFGNSVEVVESTDIYWVFNIDDVIGWITEEELNADFLTYQTKEL